MAGSPPTQSGTPRNPTLERVSGMNLDGASDRPRGSAAGSHRGSVSGSRPGSQAGSPPRPSSHRSSTPASGKANVDPARDKKPLRPVDVVGKRVDLPADAYLEVSSWCYEHLLVLIVVSCLSYWPSFNSIPGRTDSPPVQVSIPKGSLYRFNWTSSLWRNLQPITSTNTMSR